MTAVERRVLGLGLVDWVHFVEVVDLVRADDPALSEATLHQRVLDVLRSLLEKGLIEVGDVQEAGGFRRWSGTAEDTLERIGREWASLERQPGLGDVCWLANTDAGDRLAADS
jgi:hypothetical protein